MDMEKNKGSNSQHGEEDSVMVYINPEVMQSLADRAAKRKESFQELLSAAEEGDLDAAYRVAQNYYYGDDGAPEDEG